MDKYSIAKCPVCGAEMFQEYVPERVKCDICGKSCVTNYHCPNGHHLCDTCRYEYLFGNIKEICLNSKSRNPIEIAEKIMGTKEMSELGCKHYLIASLSVYTAYKNCGGPVKNFEKSLEIIRDRVSKAPNSLCRLGGLCGIPLAIGGAFQSVTLQSGSIKEKTESANTLSGNCMTKLMNPNNEGSSDCCLRNSAICIVETSRYLKNNFWIDIELPSVIQCRYYKGNPRCNKEKCPLYYGKRTEKI